MSKTVHIRVPAAVSAAYSTNLLRNCLTERSFRQSVPRSSNRYLPATLTISGVRQTLKASITPAFGYPRLRHCPDFPSGGGINNSCASSGAIPCLPRAYLAGIRPRLVGRGNYIISSLSGVRPTPFSLLAGGVLLGEERGRKLGRRDPSWPCFPRAARGPWCSTIVRQTVATPTSRSPTSCRDIWLVSNER